MSGRWLQVSFHAWLPDGTELKQPNSLRWLDAVHEVFGFTATDNLMVEATTPAAGWAAPVTDLDRLLDAVWRGEDRIIISAPDPVRYGVCGLGHPQSTRMHAGDGRAEFELWCTTCYPEEPA